MLAFNMPTACVWETVHFYYTWRPVLDIYFVVFSSLCSLDYRWTDLYHISFVYKMEALFILLVEFWGLLPLLHISTEPPFPLFLPCPDIFTSSKEQHCKFLHKWSSCWDQMGIHSLSTFASNLLHLSKWHWWWSCFTSFSHNTTTTILHSFNVHSLNEFCMIM